MLKGKSSWTQSRGKRRVVLSRVSVGVLLCLTALILLHNHQPVIGVPLFVAGFLVMNRKKRK